ncbi:VPS10 domain-containing receptor SorCS3-like [Gigantopelta aegis]|uniref:VPS10 domain-containing receptor SorCS3-like n=1 Tax=Gigantopelta aegis TaxID=1735272 RepID=UPI001B88E583|nr:VPS10 domain-containing receptor SorCS3-like [Gigantopelta aegis]
MFLLISLFCLDLSHSAVLRYNTDELHPNPVQRISLSNEPYEHLDRWRRSSSSDADGIVNKLDVIVNKLNGTANHKEAYMHWSGNKSNDIFVLTKQRNQFRRTIQSKLWVSRDYGDHFNEVFFSHTALIFYFYVSPAVPDQLIFVDMEHKSLYITKDALRTNKTSVLTFSPDQLILHPTEPNWLLAYSFDERKLRVSMDFGMTWTVLCSEVTKRIFWADPTFDRDNRTVHMEVQNSYGLAHYKACLIPNCKDITKNIDPTSEGFDSMSMLVEKEYIFIQQTTNSKSLMLVSHKRGPFKRAYFPPYYSAMNFLLVNADDGQVFMGVSRYHSVDLYLSDATGRFFVLTLDSVVFTMQPGWFQIELQEIKGMPGTFIANQRPTNQSTFILQPAKTYISFDKGGNWSLISAPEDLKSKCPTDDCHLHLHMDMSDLMIPSLLSEKNAPGLVMAHGNIGSELSNNVDIFVSNNGGWTWKQAPMIGTFRFNILDQGSVMTAILSTPKSTNIVHYSLDDGLTWQKATFLKDMSIRVDGVLNEPGISTLIESVYGHAISGGGWILVKLNFGSILKKQCDNSADYIKWKPTDQLSHGVSCILGQEIVYERKKSKSLCFNGQDYERPVKTSPCPCRKEDFECDYGYRYNKRVCAKEKWFNPEKFIAECQEGEKYKRSNGYRKVAVDKCQDGIGNSYPFKMTELPCPLTEPGGLSVTVNKMVVPTGSVVVFRLNQKMGSKAGTKYSWDFGDGLFKVIYSFNKTCNMTHIYKKYGNYNISVKAQNKKGNTTAKTFIRVEDKFTDIYVSLPWAAKVGVPINCEVIAHGRKFDQGTGHVHFVWRFGDENNETLPYLTWNKSISHVYKTVDKHLKFHMVKVTVEAINSVSTVYKQFFVKVFNNASFVELNFTTGASDFDFETDIPRRITFLNLIKRQITEAIGIGQDRFDVMLHATKPLTVRVIFVPEFLLKKSERSYQKLTKEFIQYVQNKTLAIYLAKTSDQTSMIKARTAVLINDIDTDTGNDPNAGVKPKGANMRPVFIAVPILVAAAVVTGLVLIYYKRKLRECRRYSLLRHRVDADHLLDDDDDDEPPLDLNPDLGGGGHRDMDDDHLDLGSGGQLVVTGGLRDDHVVNC